MAILRIDSSITGENSVSRQLTQAIVDKLMAARSDVQLIVRDLIMEPLGHLSLADLVDSSVVDEFLGASTVVIGAPMYNFSVPSQLKSWIDRIAIAGNIIRRRIPACARFWRALSADMAWYRDPVAN